MPAQKKTPKGAPENSGILKPAPAPKPERPADPAPPADPEISTPVPTPRNPPVAREPRSAVAPTVSKKPAQDDPPATPAVTVSPTAIMGQLGMLISGSFTATGGVPPYNFSGDGSSVGITVSSGGAYTGDSSAAKSGSFDLMVTDAKGVVSPPVSVKVSIK